MRVTDTESFIKKAREVHGDKYDYSLVDYINGRTKVTIICPDHGPYSQRAWNHTDGRGCRECKAVATGNRCRHSLHDVLAAFKKAHGNRYDYSLVSDFRCRNTVEIICRQHGVFKQDSSMHKSGQGCKKCALIANGRKRRKTIEELKGAIELHHGERYQYDFSSFKGGKSKLKIYCDRHGWFDQEASMHMIGRGCDQCARESSRPPNYSEGFFDNEENKNLPATLYHVEITNMKTGNVFQKIGISRKKRWNQRFNGAGKLGFKIRTIRTVKDTAWNCYNLEKILLDSLNEDGRLYKVHDLKGTYIGGWTEAFYPIVVK